MTEINERFHAWSHLVLFLIVFMIGLAVMNLGGPTGLVAGNQTIITNGVTDLKPFLTAVGLLMGLFIASVIVFNASALHDHKPRILPPAPKPQNDTEDINRALAKIRAKLR